MRKLVLPYDLVQEAPDLSLIIYVVLQNGCMYLLEPIHLPYDYLYYEIYGKLSVTKEEQDKIKDALSYIKDIEYDDSLITIQPEALKSKDHYLLIDLEEYKKIINRNNKLQVNHSIFHYWCHIVASFDWNIERGGKRAFIGHMSSRYFAKQLQISPATIMRYTKILEDLSVMYVIRSKYNTKTRKQIPNYYGRCEDEDIITEYVGYYTDTKSNLRRSVSAQYNCWLNDHEYMDEDELYDNIETYNKTVPPEYQLCLT